MTPKYFRYNLVVAGSGSAAFNEDSVADVVIKQAQKIRQLRNNRARVADPTTSSNNSTINSNGNSDTTKPIVVSYVGACTYDSPEARERQVGKLAQKGCKILDIAATWPQLTRPLAELRTDILASDVVLFSGGNTLYAMKRILQLGLDRVFVEAAEQGIILAGGSAGSIIPFDAGHSDSADPTTFRPKNPPTSSSSSSSSTNVEAQSEKPPTGGNNDNADWKYIRVSALGLFPGLVCPHHDRTQSNGVPRYVDFDAMLKRHSCERGICLDHWCVLIVEEGGTYELFPVPQMTGSVVLPGGREAYEGRRLQQGKYIEDASFDAKDPSAVPGMWIKEVIQVEALAGANPSDSMRIKAKCCAPRGKLEDILRVCPRDRIIEEKSEEDEVMKLNPI